MAGAKGRTQKCGRQEARTRLAHARKFIEVGELAADESGVSESASVAAALAVLAGIAAADSACCAALGQRSRGQNHHEAEALVKQITPGGKQAAIKLRRLLHVKDQAQYGFSNVGSGDARTALKQANGMIEFADGVLQR